MMEKEVKLSKAWAGHRAGTRLHVMQPGDSLQRDGSVTEVVDGEIRTIQRPCVDAQRAEQLVRDRLTRESGLESSVEAEDSPPTFPGEDRMVDAVDEDEEN